MPSDFPRSPKLLKGALVVFESQKPGPPPRAIALQNASADRRADSLPSVMPAELQDAPGGTGCAGRARSGGGQPARRGGHATEALSAQV
jgi:hypothetical protein